MATRNSKSKSYLLMSDIPGGYTKNMVVEFNDGEWRWTHNNQICIFNPVIESKFFKEFFKEEKYFDKDDFVYVNGNYKTRFVVEDCKLSHQSGKYIYIVKNLENGRKIEVSYTSLRKIQLYWFINSSGIVCDCVVPTEIEQSQKLINAYKWRKINNNIFNTKEDATLYLKKKLKNA